MNADDSTTDDDATDDEEEKETAADQDAECCFGDEANKDNLTIELEDVCNDHSAKDDGSMLQSQRSFDFEDVAPPKVWCKGDMCLAPYSGDTEYYQAVINTIRKTCNGEKQAVVTFTGYESEESELVPLRALRRVPQQRKRTKKDVVESEALLTNSSFFTHLKGNEMEESMRSKYGEYEVESQRVQAKLDSKEHNDIHKKTLARLSSSKVKEKKKGKLNVSVQRKKKLLDSRSRKRKGRTCPVVQEVKDKTDETTAEERPLQPHDLISRPGDTCATLNDDSGDNMSENGDCDMMADGFDDQDMERPCFTEPAPYSSVPFLLSEPGKQPEIQIPATMNRYLRGYQRDGVRFLYQHYSQNTGAILGDDMGLGKTVQVLAFIAAILGKTGTKADVFCKFIDGDTKGKRPAHRNGAFLIVSPGSVMYNWKDELETWGHFKTGLFHATTKAATLERALKGRLDVVLTTYETLRDHLNDLNRIKWLAVIMDEVHRLKDPKAQTTVAAKALVVKRRYGLTGTPLQNSLEEFWCVLDWANPGCLGTAKSFERTVGKPIRKGQSHVVTKRELAIGRKKSKELQNKLEKWFLRRTKDLLKDQLPKKDEMVMFCPLMPFQEDVYQTLLQHPDVELVRKKNFPCDCGSGEDRGRCCHRLSTEYEDIKTTTMRFFNLLLKVANHAALLAPSVKQTADQQEKAKDLCDKVFARYPEFTGVAEMSSFELLSDPKYCGKMKVLDKLVRVFQEEHCKLLLFSRSTQLLNILEEYIISRGLVYSRLDGSTKPADRTRLVQEFNHDPGIFVCLVSTKAGSLGLNFTGANVVIIFDPTWNPSNDLQAQDRAYRIGQRRDVRVYRLISSGTIEEMMYLRQVYKQQLANIAVGGTNERRYFTGVEGEKDRKGELFGIENLFSYRAEGASLSKDIVKRTENLEAGYRVAKYEIIPEKKNSEDDLENKVPDSSAKLTTEEKDPYNLYEIASQFIDDEEIEAGASESQETQSYAVDDLTGESVESRSQVNGSEGQQTAKKGDGDQRKRLEKIDGVGVDDEFFDALDEEGVFSSDEDMGPSMRPSEISRGSNKFKMKMKKRVSFELFSSPEDEEEQEEEKEEAVGCMRNKRGTSFTRIKKRLREAQQEQRSVDESVNGESCDVIPPTASLKSLHRGGKTRRNKEPSAGRKEQQTSSSSICDSSSELSESSESLPVNSGVKRSSRLSRKRKNANASIKKKMSSVGGGESRLRRNLGRSALDTIVANGKFVTAERSKKDDTLQGILESCGVHYTHANRSIVGPSEAENHMSKQALQDVFELRQFSQQPANCFAALETSDESDDLGVSTQPEKLEKPDITQHARQREAGSSHDQPPSGTCQRSQNAASEAWVEEIGSCTVFIGSTPRGIRRQHFRELSEILGFRSEADLAKHVIESSGEERREILKRYYAGKNPVLASLSSFSGREEKRSRKELERKHGKQGLDETQREKRGNKSKRNLRKRGTKACTVKLEDGNEFQNKALVKHKLQRSGGDVSQSNYRRNEKCLVNKFSKDREEKECTSGAGLIKSADSSTEFVRNKGEDDCRNVDTGARSITAEEAATHSVCCKEDKKRRKRLNKETKEEIEAPRTAVSASSMRTDVRTTIEVKPQGNNSPSSFSVLDEFIAPDCTRRNEGKYEIAREECEMQDARTCIRTEVHERKTSVLDDFI